MIALVRICVKFQYIYYIIFWHPITVSASQIGNEKCHIPICLVCLHCLVLLPTAAAYNDPLTFWIGVRRAVTIPIVLGSAARSRRRDGKILVTEDTASFSGELVTKDGEPVSFELQAPRRVLHLAGGTRQLWAAEWQDDFPCMRPHLPSLRLWPAVPTGHP